MALATLIDGIRELNQWSDKTIARQAVAAGHNLTPSDLTNYRRMGMKTLVPAKVVALGAGLKIPAYRVAVAVLQDLGIDVPLDSSPPERALELDISLPVHTKRAVLALLRQAREDSRSSHGA